MSDRKQENIERINTLWHLQDRRTDGVKRGRCLAFVIDRRYIESEGVAMRLAVSFGNPVVGPVTKEGFLPIPGHPGEFVFGLHQVGTKGNQLTIYDSWMDVLQAGGCMDPAEAETKGRAILDAMSDEDYRRQVQALNVQGPLKVSSTHLLEDFEVVEGEAW